MSELSEVRKKRLRNKKIRAMRDYIIAAGVIILTAVNTAFGAINIQKIADGTSRHVVVVDKEVEVPVEVTVPAETTVPEETEPEETETIPPLLLEERYNEFVCEYQNIGILLGDDVISNIRKEPSIDADCIGKAMKYSVFDVIGEEGDWYLIESEGHTGYLYKELVTTGPEVIYYAMEHCRQYAYAPKEGTGVYNTPVKEPSNLMHNMFMDKKYEVLDSFGEWVKVRINPDHVGYSKKEDCNFKYLADRPVFYGSDDVVSGVREDIINYAFEWLGGDYVWGGAVLGLGVDCSSYVMLVYHHFGIELPRLSIEQSEWGTAVNSVAEALPGDLMFFTGTHDGVNTSGVGHVAIYIGNGKMIHAASESRGIVVDDFDYLESPMAIRRVIED